MLGFTITSPTVEDWLKTIASRRTELLDVRPQMTLLLSAVQNDVDSQFDENQGTWTELADYTVKRKAEIGADPRILHETREGEGLRLRDAYRQAGRVESNGILTYTYPEEKPYAREHQEGIDNPPENTRAENRQKKPKKARKQKSRTPRHIARELRHLDDRFRRQFGLPEDDW